MGKQLTLQLYVSDSNVLCLAELESVVKAVELFTMHCKASGSVMNGSKSAAMWLGPSICQSGRTRMDLIGSRKGRSETSWLASRCWYLIK